MQEAQQAVNSSVSSEFVSAFRGSFTSMLRWHQLDDFWALLNDQADDNWYIYAVGEIPPQQTTSKEKLLNFIKEIDVLLRQEHDEDYCGIVYADNKTQPTFIKIFDPNNLGVSCGFSDNPPLPGWIISRLQPVELESALNPPNNRRRWWNRLFD